MRRVVLLVLAAVAASLAWASPVAAHPMPHSVVELETGGDSVGARLQLPAQDLSLASGITPGSGAGWKPAVRAYLAAHLRPTTDGRPWRVEITKVRLTDAEQTSTGRYREVVVNAVLTPPTGVDPQRFTFAHDAIVHRVVTHTVLVSGGGRQLGTIRTDTRSMTVAPLRVDLDEDGTWPGFAAMVRLGGAHIAEGADHLLFLLSLLLSAPLLAAGGRWRGALPARRALRRIGGITLAFTAGHSIALAVSAVSRVELPAQPVEAFIALSIVISAVHAIRPLFPGREALVAGVFGLGHGMAFAFTLAEMRLSTGQLVIGLLGFNLGIELVQLGLVAVALPLLLAVARSRIRAPLRVGGAAVTAVAAAGWLADRLGRDNPVARFADSVGSHPTAVVTILAAAAVATGVATALRTRGRAPGPRAGASRSGRAVVGWSRGGAAGGGVRDVDAQGLAGSGVTER